MFKVLIIESLLLLLSSCCWGASVCFLTLFDDEEVNVDVCVMSGL